MESKAGSWHPIVLQFASKRETASFHEKSAHWSSRVLIVQEWKRLLTKNCESTSVISIFLFTTALLKSLNFDVFIF
jgi:hypothetical protein